MDVYQLWWLSLAIAGVVIVVVAVLLGLIIAAARSIDRHALEIWTTGKQIAGNTVSIWMLEKTNQSLGEVAETARSIERHAGSIDEALAAVAGARG